MKPERDYKISGAIAAAVVTAVAAIIAAIIFFQVRELLAALLIFSVLFIAPALAFFLLFFVQEIVLKVMSCLEAGKASLREWHPGVFIHPRRGHLLRSSR